MDIWICQSSRRCYCSHLNSNMQQKLHQHHNQIDIKMRISHSILSSVHYNQSTIKWVNDCVVTISYSLYFFHVRYFKREGEIKKLLALTYEGTQYFLIFICKSVLVSKHNNMFQLQNHIHHFYPRLDKSNCNKTPRRSHNHLHLGGSIYPWVGVLQKYYSFHIPLGW